MKVHEDFQRNVFINCPFDDAYEFIFKAIHFTVRRCGFRLRCSKEFEDSSGIRIKNIVQLIRESRYSIHDLSRVSVDEVARLPRFNMPLELGICIGAIEFGDKHRKDHAYLILESQKFRFKQFVSDLSGQDIQHHNDDPLIAIKCIRNWLSKKTPEIIPSASIIALEYEQFCKELPMLCELNQWRQAELTYGEYSHLVASW